MKPRKGLLAIAAFILACALSCGGNKESKPVGVNVPEKQGSEPLGRENATGKAAALSRADFKLFRKSDAVAVDLLETRGEEVPRILGAPKKIVRWDGPDEEQMKNFRDNGVRIIITTYLYYDLIFVNYDENQNNGEIKEIRIDDPRFETTRGVAVGDMEGKLFERYGMNDREHLYFRQDEAEVPDQGGIVTIPFRYSKYYKIEMGGSSSKFFDEDESGWPKRLGMNFFVDNRGIITHIDYYHEEG
jgi:hypothetical protein